MPWIKSNLKCNDVTTGFAARFLIFTPPHSNIIPPGLPAEITKESLLAEEKFKSVLENILKEVGYSKSYSFTEDAKTCFDNASGEGFHQQIHNLAKSHKFEEILEPYLKRWSPYLLKLAMLISFFWTPSLIP